MVSNVSSLLNSILASNFSEVGKQSNINPFAVPFQPPQLLSGAETADESALNKKRDDDQQQQRQLQQQIQNQPRSLKDFTKPEISLLPSDQADLFASQVATPTTANEEEPQEVTQSTFLSDETNRNRRQALQQDDRGNLADVLQQRAQQSVAQLYARNNNVVYNVTPLFYEAA